MSSGDLLLKLHSNVRFQILNHSHAGALVSSAGNFIGGGYSGSRLAKVFAKTVDNVMGCRERVSVKVILHREYQGPAGFDACVVVRTVSRLPGEMYDVKLAPVMRNASAVFLRRCRRSTLSD